MKTLTAILILFCLGFPISCSSEADYSGIFEKKTGNCDHNFIHLRKVQGFGEKYYLIYVFQKGETWRDGKEFLGVIKKDIITINSYTIRLYENSIHVRAKSKSCIYHKVKSRTQGSSHSVERG